MNQEKFKPFQCTWRLMEVHLTWKKRQPFDPQKPFQSPDIPALSEKWPFCHSFGASLSCFQIPFISFSLTGKDKRAALKRSPWKWCPAAYHKIHTCHQAAGNIKAVTEHSHCFHFWWKAVALATVLTSGACSPGCRSAEGCEQGAVLFRHVYAALQACLPSCPSLPTGGACTLWAITTSFCSLFSPAHMTARSNPITFQAWEWKKIHTWKAIKNGMKVEYNGKSELQRKHLQKC